MGVSIFAMRHRTAIAPARDVCPRSKFPQEEDVHLESPSRLESIALFQLKDPFTYQGFGEVGMSQVREILILCGRKRP